MSKKATKVTKCEISISREDIVDILRDAGYELPLLGTWRIADGSVAANRPSRLVFSWTEIP